MVELIDGGGYRFTARELIAVSPAELLRWLSQPELMKQWMPGVDEVEVVDGNPGAEGCLSTVTLTHSSDYGTLSWRFAGRIDEIGPKRLVRTYLVQHKKTGFIPTAAYKYQYLRTITYDLAPSGAGTQLECEVRIIIPGLRRGSAHVGGKAERKSLQQSLWLLSQLCLGQRISWVRRFWISDLSPQAL